MKDRSIRNFLTSLGKSVMTPPFSKTPSVMVDRLVKCPCASTKSITEPRGPTPYFLSVSIARSLLKRGPFMAVLEEFLRAGMSAFVVVDALGP